MSRANILNTGTTNYLELIAELAPGEWTLALLEERQRGFAARAVRPWRSDFTQESAP